MECPLWMGIDDWGRATAMGAFEPSRGVLFRRYGDAQKLLDIHSAPLLRSAPWMSALLAIGGCADRMERL
jgi:hypothetical protein